METGWRWPPDGAGGGPGPSGLVRTAVRGGDRGDGRGRRRGADVSHRAKAPAGSTSATVVTPVQPARSNTHPAAADAIAPTRKMVDM